MWDGNFDEWTLLRFIAVHCKAFIMTVPISVTKCWSFCGPNFSKRCPKSLFIKVTCFKIFQKSIITWATIVQKLGAKNFKKSPTFWSHWHYRWGWPGSNEDIQFKALLRWTQAEMSFRPLPTYGVTQNSLSNLFQWAMPGIFFFIFVFSIHLPISKCSI